MQCEWLKLTHHVTIEWQKQQTVQHARATTSQCGPWTNSSIFQQLHNATQCHLHMNGRIILTSYHVPCIPSCEGKNNMRGGRRKRQLNNNHTMQRNVTCRWMDALYSQAVMFHAFPVVKERTTWGEEGENGNLRNTIRHLSMTKATNCTTSTCNHITVWTVDKLLIFQQLHNARHCHLQVNGCIILIDKETQLHTCKMYNWEWYQLPCT